MPGVYLLSFQIADIHYLKAVKSAVSSVYISTYWQSAAYGGTMDITCHENNSSTDYYYHYYCYHYYYHKTLALPFLSLSELHNLLLALLLSLVAAALVVLVVLVAEAAILVLVVVVGQAAVLVLLVVVIHSFTTVESHYHSL